jgi:hypothetical protein
LQNDIKNCQVSLSGVFEVEKEIISEEREEEGVLLFLVRSFPFSSNKKYC